MRGVEASRAATHPPLAMVFHKEVPPGPTDSSPLRVALGTSGRPIPLLHRHRSPIAPCWPQHCTLRLPQAVGFTALQVLQMFSSAAASVGSAHRKAIDAFLPPLPLALKQVTSCKVHGLCNAEPPQLNGSAGRNPKTTTRSIHRCRRTAAAMLHSCAPRCSQYAVRIYATRTAVAPRMQQVWKE